MNAKNDAGAVANWLPRIDFILPHPVDKVWPVVLQWRSWMNDYRIDAVSGTRDRLGEISRMSYMDPSGAPTNGGFLIELVEISAHRRLVYKLLPLPEPYGPIDAMQGYEVFNLYSVGEKTLVSYETLAVMQTHQQTQEAFDQVWEQVLIGTLKCWNENYIPAIQKMLAGN